MTKKGLVIVNTGDGKGKTTAALGLAMRAWGSGLRVLILQFIKGQWKYGELKAIEQLGKNIKIMQCGKGFTWAEKASADEHKKCAVETLEQARQEICSGNWDMIILDELNYAVRDGLIDESAVLELIDRKPEQLHLVITGRRAGKAVIDKADLVTEMKLVKHHLDDGIEAQAGIEF